MSLIKRHGDETNWQLFSKLFYTNNKLKDYFSVNQTAV